ncbi:MAG: CRISPR-associated endonuclease Cas1, partial [Chitinophagaceae bacterium]|nr:CRISPR-associated endonuclease Cas1 [Chitinophagaceae bacterium]
MKKTYYLFNPGRLSRKDNTLKFIPVNEDGSEGPPKYIPVEGVSDLYCFGALDANSALFNFLGKQQVAIHFFDYYEHYTGSFMPKDYLLAGKMQIEQTTHYAHKTKRLVIARKFVEGAAFNILKNLRYYLSRGKDVEGVVQVIEQYQMAIEGAKEIDELMGIEGNIRKAYYDAFDVIVNDFMMEGRSKQPPANEINALISFGNM